MTTLRSVRLSGRLAASLLCALSFAVMLAPAAKAATSVWSSLGEVGPPAASASASSSSSLTSVSCQARGACVAAGSFKPNMTGAEQPLIASHPIGDPFTADPLFLEGEGGSLLQVSCPVTGACVAVGEQFVGGVGKPLVVSLAPGGTPELESPALPGESAALPISSTEGGMLGVSCAAAGACVAVGWYAKRGEAHQPAVFVQSAGAWRSERVAPAGARSGSLQDVACASPTSCAATGSYTPISSSTARSFAATFGGASWSTTTIEAPEASSALTIESIACQAAGECLAVGSYQHGSEVRPASIVQTAGGSWSATPVALPAHASAGRLTQVSCPSVGECVAAGEFSSAGLTLPLVAYGRSLSEAEALALPPGALEGALQSIACPSGGECVAVGEYVEGGLGGIGSGASLPAVATQAAGAWTALAALAPPVSMSSPAKAGLVAVACAQPQSCAAAGGFEGTGATTRAMAAEAEPLLQQKPLTLPGAKLGRRYEETLSATGGVGVFGWSVTAGALPPGLTLNPLTGAISGTPLAAGTYRFTAQVSDVGLPVQTAEQALSIAVTGARTHRAKGKPTIRIVSSKLFARKGEVQVKVACLHNRCQGTLKISATTKLVIARLRRIYAGTPGKRPHVRYRVVRQVRHKTHILGRAGYALGAEREASFGIFVTRRVIKLLRRHENRLKAVVNATVAHGSRTHRKMWLRR